jgi:hypothetical protein
VAARRQPLHVPVNDLERTDEPTVRLIDVAVRRVQMCEEEKNYVSRVERSNVAIAEGNLNAIGDKA